MHVTNFLQGKLMSVNEWKSDGKIRACRNPDLSHRRVEIPYCAQRSTRLQKRAQRPKLLQSPSPKETFLPVPPQPGPRRARPDDATRQIERPPKNRGDPSRTMQSYGARAGLKGRATSARPLLGSSHQHHNGKPARPSLSGRAAGASVRRVAPAVADPRGRNAVVVRASESAFPVSSGSTPAQSAKIKVRALRHPFLARSPPPLARGVFADSPSDSLVRLGTRNQVIGVGGGGGNAVNRMVASGLKVRLDSHDRPPARHPTLSLSPPDFRSD